MFTGSVVDRGQNRQDKTTVYHYLGTSIHRLIVEYKMIIAKKLPGGFIGDPFGFDRATVGISH